MHAILVLTMALGHPEFTQECVITNQAAEAIEVLNPCGFALVASSALRESEMELHIAGQPWKSTETLLSEAPLPSSIPDATGFCLPSVTIPPGQALRSRLQLTRQS